MAPGTIAKRGRLCCAVQAGAALAATQQPVELKDVLRLDGVGIRTDKMRGQVWT